jgi:hypothetical protein
MIELNEFLPPVPSAHSLNALLAEYFCHRTHNNYASSLHLHTSLDVLQTELLRILNRILVPLNSQQSSPSQHLVCMLNAHSAELHRTYSKVSVCNCVLPHTVYLLRCSVTSKVFLFLSHRF